MLDKLPPELLRLVGEAACPRSEIANDVVIQQLAGGTLRRNITIVPGRWHNVVMVLEKHDMRISHTQNTVTVVKGYYYLDGERVHINVLRMSNTRIDPVDRWGVPGQRFGMVTYDTSYSWRNATITYR